MQDFVLSVGIQKSVIELTDKVAESVNNQLEKEKKLSSFLGQLLKKENYSFELANIINYLSGGICREMGWDKRTMSKFIYASTFCDVAISSEPKLAAFEDFKGPGLASLNDKEKRLVQEHINRAIDIVNKTDSVSNDEIMLIKEHHEKPDGSGYPRGINSSQIKPISAAFILAHNFARLLIMDGNSNPSSSIQSLERLGSAYTTGQFEKVFLALKKALEKES